MLPLGVTMTSGAWTWRNGSLGAVHFLELSLRMVHIFQFRQLALTCLSKQGMQVCMGVVLASRMRMKMRTVRLTTTSATCSLSLKMKRRRRDSSAETSFCWLSRETSGFRNCWQRSESCRKLGAPKSWEIVLLRLLLHKRSSLAQSLWRFFLLQDKELESTLRTEVEQQIAPDVEDQPSFNIEDVVAGAAEGLDDKAPHGAVGSPCEIAASSEALEPGGEVAAGPRPDDDVQQRSVARPSADMRLLPAPKQCHEKATEVDFLPKSVSQGVVQTDVSTFTPEIAAADRIQAQRYLSAPEPLGERRLHFAPTVSHAIQPQGSIGKDADVGVPDPVIKMFEEVRAELAASREQMQQLRDKQDQLAQDNRRLVAERDQLRKTNQELELTVRSLATPVATKRESDCSAADVAQASLAADGQAPTAQPEAANRREDRPVSDAVVDTPAVQLSEQVQAIGKAPLVQISIAAPAPPQWLPTPGDHQSESIHLQQQMLQNMSHMQDMQQKLQTRFEPPERPATSVPPAQAVADDEMRRQLLEMQQTMAETRSALAMQTAELAWHRQEKADRQSLPRPFFTSPGGGEEAARTFNIAPGGTLPSPWWNDGTAVPDKFGLRNPLLHRHHTSGIDHALRKLETDHSFGLHGWTNWDRSRNICLR
mmetsp:Transcript_64756/g.173464  ORF Transcript_64756/g.173464 Transcript_64756/m.173464 type:complete len:651 (-) Transcript_64756:77-2029(-)